MLGIGNHRKRKLENSGSAYLLSSFGTHLCITYSLELEEIMFMRDIYKAKALCQLKVK